MNLLLTILLETFCLRINLWVLYVFPNELCIYKLIEFEKEKGLREDTSGPSFYRGVSQDSERPGDLVKIT